MPSRLGCCGEGDGVIVVIMSLVWGNGDCAVAAGLGGKGVVFLGEMCGD